jgi:hypothetical protein
MWIAAVQLLAIPDCLATLQRFERDEGIEKGKFSTDIKIQKAVEQAGIHFTEDDTGEIGVRLKVRTR